MIIRSFLVAIVLLFPVKAFHDSAKRSKAFLSLNAWGLQKLGETVGINISEESDTSINQEDLGGKSSEGTGIDERVTHYSGFKETDDWASMSKIDGLFRKKSLLGALRSDQSNAEKVKHIRMAADLEGLLPCEFSSNKLTAIQSGGLMSMDWDFDFESEER